MANKLGYVGNSFEKKIYGVANVHAGKNKIVVTLLGKDGTEGDSYNFRFDDLPKVPKIQPETEDVYNVVLSPDGETVEKIGPVEGHYMARLVDFGRPEEDADPTPQLIEKQNADGKPYSYEQFTADFEIVKGKFKGVKIRHWLRYLFLENPNQPGFAGWKGNPDNPNAKHLPRLVEFCDKCGMVDEDLEWPEDGNVLPELLRRGIKANRTVDLTIKGGFVSDILKADYEEEDEPAPKKAAKKTSVVDKGNGYGEVVKTKAKKVVEEEEDDEV